MSVARFCTFLGFNNSYARVSQLVCRERERETERETKRQREREKSSKAVWTDRLACRCGVGFDPP